MTSMTELDSMYAHLYMHGKGKKSQTEDKREDIRENRKDRKKERDRDIDMIERTQH